MKILVALFAT